MLKNNGKSEISLRWQLPAAVFIFIFAILAIVQVKLRSNPLLLLERFISGGGWIEIVIISLYGAFIVNKMQEPAASPKWRKITWTIFSVVFFSQLIIGLLGGEKFLMTGKLHLPVPFMILAGPLYRGELSVMTLLFLSTVILTGPAWCSQLCYFGAYDNLASGRRPAREPLKNKFAIKTSLLILIIIVTLLLRWLNADVLTATFTAVAFGIGGIAVMVFISRKKGKMIHCILYCPIGTIINLLRPLNPFRMTIDKECTTCMRCSSVCKYDALNLQDIRNRKPGRTCTFCGDCISSCKDGYIRYNYFRMHPRNARNLWLLLTVSLHAVFLALARI